MYSTGNGGLGYLGDCHSLHIEHGGYARDIRMCTCITSLVYHEALLGFIKVIITDQRRLLFTLVICIHLRSTQARHNLLR